MTEPRISVVVSTCNRSSDLPQLFGALAQQTVNGRVPWDIVLIDNRSTDDTPQVARALAAQAPVPVACLYEGRQGKSHGLNAGVAAARGEVIAFTDDDGVPAPDWLERLLAHFEAHPDAACVGGRVELYDPEDAPITIRPSRVPRVVDAGTFAAFDIPVIGCNMAVRRDVLRAIGAFDVTVGPGAKAGTAEDLDLLYRIVASGGRIHYDPDVLVLHRHGRRTAEEVARVRTSYLIGRGAFYCKHALSGDRTVTRWAYWEARTLALAWLRGGLVTRAARSTLHDLRLIADGALRYLRHREPVATGGAPQDKGVTNA